MHILFSGRPAFLEFLRNLTPQVLLLTMALILSSRLDLTQIDLSNTPTTIAFFACICTFLLATVANSINFLENTISSLDWLNGRAIKIYRRHNSAKGRSLLLARSIMRKKWTFGLEMFVAIAVVQVGLIAASTMGILTALKAIHDLHQ